jgi:undecaprenyl-diphosphatase
MRLRPSLIDRRVADLISERVSPALEDTLEPIAYLGDEHVLISLAALYWLATRSVTPQRQKNASHVLASLLAGSCISHALKRFTDQTRPDRVVVHGRRHGVPKSGNAPDAFPSGHAVNLGVVMSALWRMAPAHRLSTIAAGSLVGATRLVLLAHWLSDAIVGVGLGVVVERTIWPLLGENSDADVS